MTDGRAGREQPLVLAADDGEDILELIVSRLEHSGYTVLQTTMIERHYGHLARDGREHAIS